MPEFTFKVSLRLDPLVHGPESPRRAREAVSKLTSGQLALPRLSKAVGRPVEPVFRLETPRATPRPDNERKRENVIFVSGGVCAGKSSLCRSLQQVVPGVVVIDMHTLLRNEQGLFADVPETAPSDTKVALLDAAMRKAGGKGPFLVDGFPDNVSDIKVRFSTRRAVAPLQYHAHD